jgi:uncharacterized protein YgfB (UPF0149 family)
MSEEFTRLRAELARKGYPGAASEAHGALCGIACVVGATAPGLWLQEIRRESTDERGTPDAASYSVAAELAQGTCRELTEGDMSLVLLLPDDEESVGVRTEALAAWCAGFMRGLGEMAGRFDVNVMGNEATREILQDFSEIARAGVEPDDSEPEAEAAYMELVEFVRVSVQLVFEEFHPLRAAGGLGVH